jgi:hypothetical protein
LALAGDPRKRVGLLDYFPITQIPHLIDYMRLEKVLPRVVTSSPNSEVFSGSESESETLRS